MKKYSDVKATLVTFKDRKAREACKPCVVAKRTLYELKLEGELSEVDEVHEDTKIAPKIRLESDCACTEIVGAEDKEKIREAIKKVRVCPCD